MNQSNNDSPKQFGLFSVIRGVDADTAEIKSTEIIIETIMPKGVCGIIAGTTGANKSFLAMQMGMSIGLALEGWTPVSIFPRWNFLLLATNQLVNHLDKINIMSNDGFKVKTIIRTGIGSQKPLNPQHQHIGDFTEAVRKMCSTIDIIKLDKTDDIFPSYEKR